MRKPMRRKGKAKRKMSGRGGRAGGLSSGQGRRPMGVKPIPNGGRLK